MTRRALVPLLAAAALSACCNVPRRDLIVVLPGADGHVGGITVEAAGVKLVLDKPYAGAKPGGGGMAPVDVGEDEVNEVFGDTLGARPVPPKSYTLYFASGGTELAPDSQATMDAMLDDMAARKAAEAVITGHTDTVGSGADNDRLSLARAKAVAATLRETFASKGVMADAIATAGRGERELLVSTPDQTAEPRNRRVDITVR
ncbi:MAG: OmpA family protein [Alphaproteobacteria bacterium]|nr:OmpA family protein [Alphaproteobacteria bacterium]